MDRIDLHIEVPRIKFEKLADKNYSSEPSKAIRERVEKARKIQAERFKNFPLQRDPAKAVAKTITNSEMGSEEIRKFCQLSPECLTLMRQAVSSLHLSARSYYRIIKVSRTIADLSESENILPIHVAFRPDVVAYYTQFAFRV